MLDSTTTHPAAEAVDRPLRRHAPGPDVLEILSRFTAWLERFGETSWDHQSFFAGPIGGRAKALYYRQKALGTAAVAPMILCEALLPSARQLFHHRIRFPIADAHYAMGFAYLHEATRDPSHLAKANSFSGGTQAVAVRGVRGVLLGLPIRLGDAQRHDSAVRRR